MPSAARSRLRPRQRGMLAAPWLARGVAALFALYTIYFVAMMIMQDRLVFPAAGVQPKKPQPPSGVEQWWFDAPGDVRVEAWFQPGEGRTAASPGPAVIYFHGNGDLVDYRWNEIQPYRYAGISTLAVEFRGYGRSGGKPSIDAIIADAIAFRDRLIARPEVDPRQIVYHGLSLGGGLAIALAEKAPPAAIVAVSTFANMDELIARFGLPPQASKHRLNSAAIVVQLDAPLLVIHGRQDMTIPISHGRRLAQAARHGRLVELNCGHSDVSPHWPSIRQHLIDAGIPFR